MSPSLITPLYLFGLLAAAIPLIIHLSRSRRTKKMRFSTTRFFTEQFLRSYRMNQLREILLLLCRMALFAVLAMALAGPFLKPRGEVAFGGGARTVILILDDSASMGLKEAGGTPFERARTEALRLLDNLNPGDNVSVILAGRRAGGPEVLFPDPTEDLDEVRAALKIAEARPLATDLTAALAQADVVAAASRATGERAVGVYVLTDMQETSLDEGDDTPRAGSTDTSYFFVSFRPKAPPVNRAVAAVRYAATRPRVGVPFSLRPLLSLGRDDGEDVPVRLFVDGARVGEQKAERLPGNKWASPRFYHAFTAPGWHAGHVEVDDPILAADNRRYFALEVPASTATVPILAINGAPSAVAAEDELFFLRFALTAAPDGQAAPFSLTAISPGELASFDLSKYPLVLLANVERLTDAAIEKLEQYADDGGKLLVFLGDKVDPAFYNGTLAAPSRRNGGLLPARVKGAKLEEAGFIAAIDYEHRALAAFQEPRMGTLLGPSLTFKALALEAPANAVLMKASTGIPLLCEREYGKGKVLLFASTCDKDWSDFPIRPAFLLWSRFLADYLTQAPLGLQSGHLTGDPIRLVPPPGDTGTLHVLTPGGKIEPATYTRDGSGAFEFTNTLEPGIYTVLRSDRETKVGLFAVNLDTYESDLAYLDDPEDDENGAAQKARVEKDLKARLGKPPLLRYIADPVEMASTLGGSSGGWKLWNVFLVIVLLVGLFEPWLANQISGKMYARTVQIPTVAPPGVAARAEEVRT